MKKLGILVAALALAGCAGTQTQTGLVTSGQALIGVGNTFVTVAKTYDVACKPQPRVGVEKFCAGFKDFTPKFQKAYSPAVDAWEAARKANDVSKQQDATAVILSLSTELTALAVQVLGTVQ
jgi:hypothetical protein